MSVSVWRKGRLTSESRYQDRKGSNNLFNNYVNKSSGLYYFSIEPKVRNIANPRFVKHAEKNLRRKLRQLSRKAKDIENRAKARLPARSQVIWKSS